MKINYINKGKIFVVAFLFFVTIIIQSNIVLSNESSIIKNSNVENQSSEYWALLISVGVYADDPQQNRPLMLEEVDDLYELLLESNVWSEDHIKVLKGADSTVSNIISGFQWLDNMEDEKDISLVFITTHGSPLGFDIPPIDEEDNTDEILATYWTFAYNRVFLWDDELNFLLNRLESKGVCFIVDSCYAGGFNDPPDWNKTIMTNAQSFGNEASVEEWMEGFAEELRGQGRVVLMASREDEVSFSGGFAPFLIDGLRGFADSNMDGVVTAEETFVYAEPRTSRQHPTIYDGYEGELPLIDFSGQLQYGGETSAVKQSITKESTETYTPSGFYPEDGLVERKSNVQHLTKYEKSIDESQSMDIESSDDMENDNEQMITREKTISLSLDVAYSPENSMVCGYVKDAGTADPIENALIYIRGYDNEFEFFENDTTTDSYGFYSMNVPACWCWITVYADEYCSEELSHLQIDENEIVWINFSLYPRPPENSLICGYITGEETGTPIEGANIGIFWRGDQNQFYINDTTSDDSGFYSMDIAAGEVDIEVEASGYFRGYSEDITILEYETKWVNFSLYARPIENAVVCGYITDEKTGDPINHARVTFEWVDVSLGHSYQNETYTDSSGFYSINIAAGELYHDIRKQGYDYYNPYRCDAEADTTLWMNVSLIEETIEVDLTKPLNALYINNNRIIPYSKARIIGKIDIEASVYESWYGPGQAERVEFYIDNVLKASVTTEPFTWTWAEKTLGRHTIKVVAYDYEGNSVSKEREVLKTL